MSLILVSSQVRDVCTSIRAANISWFERRNGFFLQMTVRQKPPSPVRASA